MSVALIESFDRLRNYPSTGSGTFHRNDCYTKCGGFDKLNHRNANLLDSLFSDGAAGKKALVMDLILYQGLYFWQIILIFLKSACRIVNKTKIYICGESGIQNAAIK